MKPVHLVLTFLLLSAVAGSAVGAHATDSVQADSRPGILASGSVNTTTSGGTLDQQSTTTSSGYTFTNSNWVGQTFTAGMSGALTQVDLNMFCNNCTTSRSVIVSVRATSGGLPTGSDLATATLTVGTSGVYAWYSAPFGSPASLSAGTQYALLIRSATTISANFLYFSMSAYSAPTYNVYPGGALIVSGTGGTPWTVATVNGSTVDGAFKTYVGGSTSASADLSITNTDGATTETPGTPVTYTITASNPAGSSSVTGATVTDAFPAALTSCSWTCAGSNSGTCKASGSGNISDSVNLPGGASVTYTATCSIAPSATGSLSNTASVALPAGVNDPNPGNNSATDTDTLALQADLGITNSDGVTTANPGGSVTYAITASNPGPSSVTAATVADTFPPSLTCNWTCSGAGGGTCTSSGSGNINNPVNLPGGASVTFLATCSISTSASGTLTNTATVAAPAGVSDPTSSNNSATDSDSLAVKADVRVTVSDGVSAARLGDVLTYVINITNAGPSIASVNVDDALPTQLSNGSWVCTGSGGATCGKASGNNNTINTTATVPPGGNAAYVFTATVANDNSMDSFTNTASATLSSGTDPNTANNSASDTDLLVVFLDGFDGSQTLAMNVATAGGGGSYFTAQLGVDAGLLNSLGTAPVTIASGRSASGKSQFSVQLIRLGADIAMRTLTSTGDGVFSDVSPWHAVDLGPHLLTLDWQSASARGHDGYLNVEASGSPMRVAGHDAKDPVTQLQIAVENNIPWLVPVEP